MLTDFLDSGVLTAVMFCGPIDEHRFVDVSENAFYWNFVVLSWLPIYALIYLAPRSFDRGLRLLAPVVRADAPARSRGRRCSK